MNNLDTPLLAISFNHINFQVKLHLTFVFNEIMIFWPFDVIRAKFKNFPKTLRLNQLFWGINLFFFDIFTLIHPVVINSSWNHKEIETEQEPAGSSQGQVPVPQPHPMSPASCLQKHFSLWGLPWVLKSKFNQRTEKMQKQRKTVKQGKIIIV